MSGLVSTGTVTVCRYTILVFHPVLQRQLEDQYAVHWHRYINMGGSRRNRSKWPQWCAAALQGESYSLSHGNAKAMEGYCCQSQSRSHVFKHFPMQHLWSTMYCKDWPNHSHEESQELVQTGAHKSF